MFSVLQASLPVDVINKSRRLYRNYIPHYVEFCLGTYVAQICIHKPLAAAPAAVTVGKEAKMLRVSSSLSTRALQFRVSGLR